MQIDPKTDPKTDPKSDPKNDLKPEKSPQEKSGWNLMLIGFVILLFAGGVFFLAKGVNHAYTTAGNYLMAVGLAVYVTGRIFQWRGRRERRKDQQR